MDNPPIFVAHPNGAMREALAAALAAAWPQADVRPVALAQLDPLLAIQPQLPIVVTSDATVSLQTLARGWIVLLEHDDVAFAGVGDSWQTLVRPGIAEIATAIADLIDRTRTD